MAIRTALLVLLGGFSVVFIIGWWRAAIAQRLPSLLQSAIGFVTNFFDTLGIGSFATTTALYKVLKVVADERLVGTLLVGHSLPVVVQAFIFLVAVQVDPAMLAALVVVSILGSWMGASVATKLPIRPIQIAMGVGLIAAATFATMTQLGVFPGGGEALALPPARMAIALVGNFVFGALLTLGIGNYAPTLILFSILGLNPLAAFPIMMSSGAMMSMVSGLKFMKAGRFDTRAALGLTLGGIPGVLIAGLIVRSLPLEVLRWVVIAVVLYAATMMLRSAFRRNPQGALEVAG